MIKKLTKRVAVKSVDVDVSFGVGSNVSGGESLVADQRYNNACTAELLLNIDEVVLIRLLVVGEAGVLVLWLHQNDRTTVRDLGIGNDGTNVRHVVLGSIEVCLVRCPQSAGNTLQPAGETSTRDFGVDVRAGSSDQVDTSFGGGFEEFLVAKDAFSGKVSRLALVERPMGVERNAVVAKRLDLLEDVCR